MERAENREEKKERKKERGRPFKDSPNANKICWRNLMTVVRIQLP
jgi:hypothetical protein